MRPPRRWHRRRPYLPAPRRGLGVTLVEFVLGVAIAVVIIVTAVNILIPGGAP